MLNSSLNLYLNLWLNLLLTQSNFSRYFKILTYSSDNVVSLLEAWVISSKIGPLYFWTCAHVSELVTFLLLCQPEVSPQTYQQQMTDSNDQMLYLVIAEGVIMGGCWRWSLVDLLIYSCIIQRKIPDVPTPLRIRRACLYAAIGGKYLYNRVNLWQR